MGYRWVEPRYKPLVQVAHPSAVCRLEPHHLGQRYVVRRYERGPALAIGQPQHGPGYVWGLALLSMPPGEII